LNIEDCKQTEEEEEDEGGGGDTFLKCLTTA
jgi:hypothetical protein